MVNSVEWVGYVAAFCTTLSFLPQTIKVIRTRDTESLSLAMYLLFCTGIFCWLVYGILIAKAPLIIPNLITLVLAMTILFMKIADIRKQGKISKK